MGCRHFLGYVLLLLCLSTDRAEGKKEECSLKGEGVVTNFKGQNYKVLIPCKFRLVHMTCGDYSVKVTPGQGVDEDHLFYPDSVWVGITRKKDGVKRVWKGRTSIQRLQKAKSVGEVWQEKQANITLDSESFSSSSQTALLEMRGVFRISYTVRGAADKRVLVSCSARPFQNRPYPQSLCGDQGNTQGLIESRRQEILARIDSKHNTKENMIIYDVLNNDKVRQRKICEYSARKFAACGTDGTVMAAQTCGNIFSYSDLTKCLVSSQDLVSNFDTCLSAVCGENNKSCWTLYDRAAKTCRKADRSVIFDSLRCRDYK